MKQSDFHTKIAAAFKLAEDSGCCEVVKHSSTIDSVYDLGFHDDVLTNYEFALAVVEGKAVFVGDTLYDGEGGQYIANSGMSPAQFAFASWNPPKPKTVTVEMSCDLAEWYATSNFASPEFISLTEQCRKALKGESK